MDNHVSTSKRGIVKQMCMDLAKKDSAEFNFKNLKHYQRQVLINMLIEDKHIPPETKLDIMRSNRKDIPHPPIPRRNIRGQRASMMIFDCSFGCKHSNTCKRGKECPYDKKD